MDRQPNDKNQPHIVQIMMTEHYNLQSGRSITVSDANGRSSLFLSTVSSTLIALAFIGNISHLGTAFFVFALVLFPSLLFLGLVTFERVLQSAIEDVIYARGINRIRHLYVELAPQVQDYFILSTHDDRAGTFLNLSGHPSLVVAAPGDHSRDDQRHQQYSCWCLYRSAGLSAVCPLIAALYGCCDWGLLGVPLQIGDKPSTQFGPDLKWSPN